MSRAVYVVQLSTSSGCPPVEIDHVFLQSNVLTGVLYYPQATVCTVTSEASLTPQLEAERLMLVKHVLDAWDPRQSWSAVGIFLFWIPLLVTHVTMNWSLQMQLYALVQILVVFIGVCDHAHRTTPVDEICCIWICI